MYPYAQTNLQLFNQLRREGYTNADLVCVANAYRLTIDLFTGHFRPSGKTFIAHLVGTASILASLHTPAKLVAAGLIHAAYSHGDFGGTGRKGITPSKRQRVIRAIGSDIEEYIVRYTELKWKKHIPVIYKQVDGFDGIERDVLLIRLANELEEYNDIGILYCSDRKCQQYTVHQQQLIVEMAEKLGYLDLATQLNRAFQAVNSEEIPPELRSITEQEFSAMILPNSCQRTLSVWFDQVIVRRLRNLRARAWA